MNQKTIPRKKLEDSGSETLQSKTYHRFALPSAAKSRIRARFQYFLSKFKANPELVVTKVEPYLYEEVAYIVTPKSDAAAAIRASYLVTKTFQEAYTKAYVGRRREATGRRVRTR